MSATGKTPKEETTFMIVWRVIYPVLIFYAAELFSELAFCLYDISKVDASLRTDVDALSEAISEMITDQSLIITSVRCLILIPIFILFMRADTRKDMALGRGQVYRKVPVYWYLLLPIVGFCSAIGFNQVIEILDLAKFSPNYQKVSQVVYSGSAWLTIVSSVVLAPVVEELLFRGLIYKRTRNHLKSVFAALISSILFGLIHGNLVQFVYAFCVGMIICWVYETFKNIWAPIIFHAGANLISVLLTEFVPQFGGSLSSAQYMLLTVAWLAAAFLILWLFHCKIKTGDIHETFHS